MCTDWFLRTTPVVRHAKIERDAGAYNSRLMKFALYFSDAPAPKALKREQLDALTPVYFSTERDALHGAALVIRGGRYPWRVEGPGVRLDAREIGKRCEPLLAMFKRSP